MEKLSLSGKVAIITGSSSGIGAATAKVMARRGAMVTLHGRDQDKLASVKDGIIKSGVNPNDIIVVVGDITDPSVRQNLVTETINAFGRIDILVNCAGAYESVPLVSVTQDYLAKSFDLLLFAPVLLSQLCQPHLAKTKGNIINISAIGTEMIFPANFAFTAAKAALDIFTRQAALEFSTAGIRVNTIKPGVVDSPFWKKSDKKEDLAFVEMFLETSKNIALTGFNGQPEDIAEIIAFYASDAARFITADINICDGGLSKNNPFAMAFLSSQSK